MICKLLIAAQNIIVDFQSKRASTINIFEDFFSTTYPIVFPLSIMSIISKEDDEENNPEIFLKIILNDQQTVLEARLDIFFDNGRNALKNVVNIGGLVIPTPGKVSFSIHYNNNTIAYYDVYAKSRVSTSVANTIEAPLNP